MAGSRYMTGTNHRETLSATLDAFQRALTRRWREVVAGSIELGTWDGFPDTAQGSVWDFTSPLARAHIDFDDGYPGMAQRIIGCQYLAWVWNGQPGSLDSVACDGRTSGALGAPQQVYCGVGSILKQVEDWAWEERERVFQLVPLFDTHDVAAIEEAHNRLISLGNELGLEPAGSPDGFTAVTDREIGHDVDEIANYDAGSQDWWAGWTGLAAERAGSGFFASVAPSLNNQSRILAALAHLYSARASIIETGRRNSITHIVEATKALYQTEMVPGGDPTVWVWVEGAGMFVSIVGAWSGVGSAIGAAVSLVGFLGQIAAESETRIYSHDMMEVMAQLNDRISDLNTEIAVREVGYGSAVRHLREGIHGVHSYNLELYDLTENNPEGDHHEIPDLDATTFTVVIGEVLRLAEYCYKLGERHAALLPTIADTRLADRHLADRDGRQTQADRDLLEVRDMLEDFLETTCGRYLVAAKQVEDAAIAYVDVDTSQKDDLERIMDDWSGLDVGGFDPGFDPEEYAVGTDRPWGWAPVQEIPGERSSRPGAYDGKEYAIDELERSDG
jgi:hypothetical protein